jgi:serine/threonine protein kinase
MPSANNNSHRNIVTAVDYGVALVDGVKSPFFVMPLFNDSLRTVMARGIPVQKALPIFSQILDGVEAAHLHGVVHRDLKPENCLYNAKDGVLVVADFGIAQFTAEELYTLVETGPHARLANFQYAAPEQRSRKAVVDKRADIYSLGLILNELFTGQVPHGTQYKTIGLVVPEYSYLDDIAAEMLRQDPGHRPAKIEAVKHQLIARDSDFVEKQRLDALRRTVVPSKEVSDPLISDPPRLLDAKWNGTHVILILSRPINQMWIWCLQNMGSFTSVLGKEPERFEISGNKATIAAREIEIQDVVDYFKGWLPRVNSLYAENALNEARRAEEQERKWLKDEITAADLRARVNASIRI